MKFLRSCVLVAFFTGFLAGSASAQKMARAEEPEEVGLTSIGDAYFPNPEKFDVVSIPNGGFENGITNTEALQLSRFVEEKSSEAPEGKAFASKVGNATGSLTLNAPADPGTPYLVSAWLKTEFASTANATSVSQEIYFGKSTPLDIPNTEGKWKRVGWFFRTAPGTTAIKVLLRFPEGGAAIDDIRLRAASEMEFGKAYAGWRSQYPERDLSPRPGDGKNLSLFVSKLTDPLLPNEPLRVIGIGSSYTNMLGNGERLVQWIREKFPMAPPIHYQKHVGSAVNYDFTRGWMRQHVLGKRPDLVILYSGGDAADLEKMLADFRAHSAADVIVASLHLRERDEVISDETINAPEWDAIRDVALKYGCEWVDSRREWGAYLREHGQPIEWLLKDAVHQSDHGALVINENICRHIVANPEPNSVPESRERFLPFVNDARGFEKDGEAVSSEGEAKVGAGLRPGTDSLILLKNGTSGLQVRFRGNRVDLVGRRSAGGGALGGVDSPIEIDGVPLDELPVFVTTLIIPGAKNFKPGRGLVADRAPHQVILGAPEKIVPQTWTLRMISDTGDFELIGSITGPDGTGNNAEDFTSDTGQITVPTELWRRRLETDGSHSNRTGDTFTWRVKRATTPEVSFRGEAGELFSVTLADQLGNGWHELFIGSGDHGPCEILGVRIYEPPVGR